ncbi:type II toxin-antitoxin system tRNA(fMet)-specific endonuclease VapC [Pseudidiomarina homiensis]|uniref:Ribonuclease VapC n=1 Tax=Pseudidiomarina homiensis TaxID=364198 RepID=A0A432Y3L0_9GAMM|nr:type II toxin-antitoxin system VapC family toxin [Pseudidiomarina homiensis]RUO55543.1 VapC toxin family PIN domain ribonuclease [Pseudidiomarina homiensis]
MLHYLLDTNFCIYLMKNRPAFLLPIFEQHSRQIAVSSITVMELYYGVERSMQRVANGEKLASFLARVQTLDFDVQAAAQTAIIRSILAQQGTPIGPYDQMIAGHARAQNLTVVTNNRREFDRVDGLLVENWLEQPPTATINEASPAYR